MVKKFAKNSKINISLKCLTSKKLIASRPPMRSWKTCLTNWEIKMGVPLTMIATVKILPPIKTKKIVRRTKRVGKTKSIKRVKRRRRRNTNVAVEVLAGTETAREGETGTEVAAGTERAKEREIKSTGAVAGTERAREGETNTAAAIVKTSQRMKTHNACRGQCRRPLSPDRATNSGTRVTIKLKCGVTSHPLHLPKSGFEKILEINLRRVTLDHVTMIVTPGHVTMCDVALTRAIEVQEDRKMITTNSGTRSGKPVKFRKMQMRK